MALLLPPLARRDRGARASTSRARASAARRTSAYVQRGSIRTLMWIPREPDVFGQPTSPTASSASWQTSATSRICGHSIPGHRVEVDPQLVGVVEVLGPDRVRVEVDAAEVDDPGQPGRPRRGRSRRRSGPDGKVSSAVRIQSGVLSGARFWKNGSFVIPSTNRFSAIGRPPAPRSAPSATAR